MLVKRLVRVALVSVLGLLASCGGGGGDDGDGGGGGDDQIIGLPGMPLYVARQPAGGTSSTPFTIQPIVNLMTEAGINTADSVTSVTASIASGGSAGAKLTGTVTVRAVAGVVTFTNLGIDKSGTGYVIRFRSSGDSYRYWDSEPVNIIAPTTRSLAIATEPEGAETNALLMTQPTVQVRVNGLLDSTDNTTVVTASISPGTGYSNSVLLGTTTATVVAGVATFTNLSLNTFGSYKLRFTANSVVETDSRTFWILDPGMTIPGWNPPPSDVQFIVSSVVERRPISRFIYGMNDWDPRVRPANLTLSRSGGNRMTAYNWETNASNAGADYHNQNDDFLGGGLAPNGAVAPGLERARNAGAGMIVTMPLIGYVSADKNGDLDVANTPNYLAVRFHQSVARKNAAFTMTPDTTDHFVYQDEYIHFLDQAYAGAFAAANNPIMINLDNEPDLWQSTHARLRGDTNPNTQSGTTATYAEMIQRTVDYAGAAKAVNPAAQIFGPVNYGWQGMIRFQDAADAADRDFLNYYLQQMASAEATAGRRLVDVLDVHWYPEARGACTGNPMDGCRVTDNNNEAGVVAARMAAPRSLWDSTYVENSWITQSSLNGAAIKLLPRLKEKIDTNYPGTKLGITEYNYGGANHISGAIAQADVLGIFGRQGLYAATLWRLESNNAFIYGGFDAYRNYDGSNGTFGDTSIHSFTNEPATTSVYGSVNDGDTRRMVIVAINKNATAKSVGINVIHTALFRTAQVYQVTSTNSVPQRQPDVPIPQNNAFQYFMPAYSVTTLVLLP